MTCKAYDLADPEPRAVIHQRDIPLTNMTTTTLPGEVAICLSFEAERVSGVNMARRRGRVFLGPIQTGVNGTGAEAGRPDTGTRGALVAAAAALLNSSGSAGDPHWAIYSPTDRAAGASLEDSTHDVDHGWIDNAFDTVRSRGLAPTTRGLF